MTTRRTLILLVLAGAAASMPFAVTAQPSDSMTRGKLAVDLGDLASAEKIFADLAGNPAASERARAEALVRLGVVRRAQGKAPASANAFRKAIESPAREAEVTRLLAVALGGVVPDRTVWAKEWRKVGFTIPSGTGSAPTVEWPGPRPLGVREALKAQDLVTFDLEDVPLNAFLHHLLVPWGPRGQADRGWPGPRLSPGFETWPESYQPPAAVARLGFAIHSGVKGDLKERSSETRVTVKVSGMPWSELFESVLASNGLGFAVDNGLLFIARVEDLGAFEQVRRRIYSGPTIRRNFLDGDLRDVFRLFSDISGLQIIPDEGLPGSITSAIAERPAMELLDVFLAANDLTASAIATPDGEPSTTGLRIRRLADGGDDSIDLSQLPANMASVRPPTELAPTTPVRFESLEGAVQVMKRGTSEWVSAGRDMQLNLGDLVRTGPGATAEIRFVDGFVIRLKPDSLVTIDPRRPL